MCFGDDKSSNGGSQKAPRPVPHVPLSIERTSWVAVPAQARPPPRTTVHQTPQRTNPRPVNTYKQPNPWPPELVLEHANYKAADVSHGAASSRYRRERKRREAEVKAQTWSGGRETFAPGHLTPESHFELRPMAVDWEDKAQTHYILRKGFDDAHPRAYESPKAKEDHQERIHDTEKSIRKAKMKVEEHELYQGNFMQSDPYDVLDWATGGSSNLPEGRRKKPYEYHK